MPRSLEETIEQAAKDRKVVRLQYRDLKGKDSVRNVEPYEFRGAHLFAYCRKRKGIRRFDLSRVSSAKVTSYSYLPKYPVQIDGTLKKTASFRLILGARTFGPYEDAPLD